MPPVKLPKTLNFIAAKATTLSGPTLIWLARSRIFRGFLVREVEKLIYRLLRATRFDPTKLPGAEDDKSVMALAMMDSVERALAGQYLSDDYIKLMLRVLVKSLFYEQGDWSVIQRFKDEYGLRAPSFLLLSPSKACNLRCSGCYADSTDKPQTLDWSIVDRMITEAKELWGARLIVFSGGEPFAYRSEGKGMLELIEKHQDCFFLAFTNSTLITEQVSKRLSKAGNMLLAISVEGWRERTDQRRGAGVFDKILETMKMLRKDGVPFGISLTGTRYNAEEILSDDFIRFFRDQGVLFAWLFQYMPIGRSYTIDLMVTPQQRAWMWKRSWQIVREQRFFLADFWNHGTCVDGCLSAGGHGGGGYFYVDWNGAVTPCVFTPYSPVNIRDVYARGGSLNDVYQEPYFQALRQWQLDFKKRRRNGLAPCPNRDHHDEMEQMLRQYEPEPTDTNATETLTDPGYTAGLVAYHKEFDAITSAIWDDHDVNRPVTLDTPIVPLPDLPEQVDLPANEEAVH